MTKPSMLRVLVGADESTLEGRITILNTRINQIQAEMLSIRNKLTSFRAAALDPSIYSRIKAAAKVRDYNSRYTTLTNELSAAQSSLQQLQDTLAQQTATQEAVAAKTAVVEQASAFTSAGKQAGFMAAATAGIIAFGAWFLLRTPKHKVI